MPSPGGATHRQPRCLVDEGAGWPVIIVAHSGSPAFSPTRAGAPTRQTRDMDTDLLPRRRGRTGRGHRPCGLCRRTSYVDYRDAVSRRWIVTAARCRRPEPAARPGAASGGRGLDRGPGRILTPERIDRLPPGAVIVDHDHIPRLVLEDRLLRFTFAGWAEPRPRPRTGVVSVLTPPTSVAALANGYTPVLHPTTCVEQSDVQHEHAGRATMLRASLTLEPELRSVRSSAGPSARLSSTWGGASTPIRTWPRDGR